MPSLGIVFIQECLVLVVQSPPRILKLKIGIRVMARIIAQWLFLENYIVTSLRYSKIVTMVSKSDYFYLIVCIIYF